MHDDVLILHDKGPEYLRTVKLAALYANRVHVFGPASEGNLYSLGDLAKTIQPTPANVLEVMDMAARQDAEIREAMNDATLRRDIGHAIQDMFDGLPFSNYLRVCAGNWSDLEQLKKEGVVISILDNVLAHLPKQGDPWPPFFSALQAIAENASKTQIQKLKSRSYFLRDFAADGRSAGSILDSLLAVIGHMHPKKLPADVAKVLQNEGVRRAIAGGTFFLVSSFYASQKGCIGVTWDSATQDCFEKFCDVLYSGAKENNAYILRRDQVRTRIGRRVLEDQIPDVSSLPIETILEIRRDRDPELRYFRDSLGRLSSQIDPELKGDKLTAAIDGVVTTEVRPALNDLNASLASLEGRRYSGLLKMDGNVITFAISSLAGVPLDIPLQAGALGVAASKFIDFTFGHKTEKASLLRSNPWSVLFHLNGNLRRGRR
jgi:hypothetical protein